MQSDRPFPFRFPFRRLVRCGHRLGQLRGWRGSRDLPGAPGAPVASGAPGALGAGGAVGRFGPRSLPRLAALSALAAAVAAASAGWAGPAWAQGRAGGHQGTGALAPRPLSGVPAAAPASAPARAAAPRPIAPLRAGTTTLPAAARAAAPAATGALAAPAVPAAALARPAPDAAPAAAAPGQAGPATATPTATPTDAPADAPATSPTAAATAAALPTRSVAATAPASPDALRALLGRVLAQDPQVRVAQTLLQAADERRKQARSRLAPNLALSLNRGHASERDIFDDPIERRLERADLALRWNLLNGGNDLGELDATARERLAAEQELRRAREEVAERVSDAYLDAWRLEDLLPRTRRRLAGVQRLVALVERQNALGKAADSDAQQARASLLDAEVSLDQLDSERLAAYQKLARLAGEPVARVEPVLLPAVPEGADGATGQIRAARLRAEAARQRVPTAASLALPRVDLELRNQLHDRTLPAATTTEQHAWNLSARWDVPLGGESVSRRTESQRRADAAQAEADRLWLAARAELDALVPRLASAERALVRLDSQIEQYQGLLRAGEVQFEAGRRTLSQLIGLHDSLFGAEQRRAEQAYRLQQGRLRRLSLSGQLLPALGLAASDGAPAP